MKRLILVMAALFAIAASSFETAEAQGHRGGVHRGGAHGGGFRGSRNFRRGFGGPRFRQQFGGFGSPIAGFDAFGNPIFGRPGLTFQNRNFGLFLPF